MLITLVTRHSPDGSRYGQWGVPAETPNNAHDRPLMAQVRHTTGSWQQDLRALTRASDERCYTRSSTTAPSLTACGSDNGRLAWVVHLDLHSVALSERVGAGRSACLRSRRSPPAIRGSPAAPPRKAGRPPGADRRDGCSCRRRTLRTRSRGRSGERLGVQGHPVGEDVILFGDLRRARQHDPNIASTVDRASSEDMVRPGRVVTSGTPSNGSAALPASGTFAPFRAPSAGRGLTPGPAGGATCECGTPRSRIRAFPESRLLPLRSSRWLFRVWRELQGARGRTAAAGELAVADLGRTARGALTCRGVTGDRAAAVAHQDWLDGSGSKPDYEPECAQRPFDE